MRNETNSLSEADVDEIVETEAADDAAWEDTVRVRRTKPEAIPLSPKIAARVAFFARLHGATHAEEWLARVIEERIRFEEAAFAEIKRDLTVKNNDR